MIRRKRKVDGKSDVCPSKLQENSLETILTTVCGLTRLNRRASGCVSEGRAISRTCLSKRSLFAILEAEGVVPTMSYTFQDDARSGRNILRRMKE